MHDDSASPFWEFIGIGLAVIMLIRTIIYWWSYRE